MIEGSTNTLFKILVLCDFIFFQVTLNFFKLNKFKENDLIILSEMLEKHRFMFYD